MYLSYGKRIAIKLVIIIALICSGVYLIYNNAKEKIALSLGYSENSKVDYKIYLSENDDYETPYLEKGKEYLSSLIDYIDTQFHYNFKLNENFNNSYKYYVEAEVVVYGKTKENTIYTKKQTILEEKITTETLENSFYVLENVKVDYQSYNTIAKNFKSKYGLTNESELIIRFIVEIDGTYDNEYDITNASSIEITLPLTEQTVLINTDYKEQQETDVITVKAEITPKEYAFIGVGIFLSLMGICLFINLLFFIRRAKSKTKTAYDKIINKLLTDYDRIIVNIKEPIEITDDMELREVTTFSELLDISDRLEESILYNEIHKGQKSIFVVQHGKQVYRVVIKAVDLEPETKKTVKTKKVEEKDYEEIFKDVKDKSKKNNNF